MIGIHCDRTGCDTWQRSQTDLPEQMIEVQWGPSRYHFCTVDHLLLGMAELHPQATVGGDTDE